MDASGSWLVLPDGVAPFLLLPDTLEKTTFLLFFTCFGNQCVNKKRHGLFSEQIWILKVVQISEKSGRPP